VRQVGLLCVDNWPCFVLVCLYVCVCVGGGGGCTPIYPTAPHCTVTGVWQCALSSRGLVAVLQFCSVCAASRLTGHGQFVQARVQSEDQQQACTVLRGACSSSSCLCVQALSVAVVTMQRVHLLHVCSWLPPRHLECH
jgi:hypothetical protein